MTTLINQKPTIRPVFIETDEARAKRLGFLSVLPLPKRRWVGEEVSSLVGLALREGSYDCSRSVWEGWK